MGFGPPLLLQKRQVIIVGGLTSGAVIGGLTELGKLFPEVILVILAIELVTYLLCKKLLKSKYTVIYMFLAPAVVGVFAFIIYPFIFNVYLAFSNMNMFRFKTFNASLALGYRNFVDVFVTSVLQKASFVVLLVRSIIWTAINVFFHVTLGMCLAILLNRPMRLQGLYRTILILPWAVPQVVSALAWKGEFHYQYGFVNNILATVGIAPVQWLQNPVWAMVAVILVNIWLGIPFMMIVILGGLQSISDEYYNAAQIDGASAWQQFRHITLPLLKPVLTPAIILGTVWTFNQFNVIYLITEGGPIESTDILITALYKAIFTFYRYGFGAMYSLVLFGMMFIFSIFYLKISGGFKGVNE